MNAFEFGFYDELEKIAAYELKGVKPEVAREIKERLKGLVQKSRGPWWYENSFEGDPRLVELNRDKSRPELVSFEQPETGTVKSFDMKNPDDSWFTSQIRKRVAKRKGELLARAIAEHRMDNPSSLPPSRPSMPRPPR